MARPHRERAALLAADASHRYVARAIAEAARHGADDRACAAVKRAAEHEASATFPERLRRVEAILEGADLAARIVAAAI